MASYCYDDDWKGVLCTASVSASGVSGKLDKLVELGANHLIVELRCSFSIQRFTDINYRCFGKFYNGRVFVAASFESPKEYTAFEFSVDALQNYEKQH
ncbi:MAG: hypothetical protein LBT46_01070 [Planctomycetaceae bacterium]|nr:hypothetical protein [Planctomycetaceae bacterium]